MILVPPRPSRLLPYSTLWVVELFCLPQLPNRVCFTVPQNLYSCCTWFNLSDTLLKHLNYFLYNPTTSSLKFFSSLKPFLTLPQSYLFLNLWSKPNIHVLNNKSSIQCIILMSFSCVLISQIHFNLQGEKCVHKALI